MVLRGGDVYIFLVNLLDEKLVATLLGTALGKAGAGLNHVRWPHRTQYT